MQSQADTHLQNSLPGKDIATKTTQPFLKKSTSELAIYAIMTESQIFLSRKFSKSFIRFIT